MAAAKRPPLDWDALRAPPRWRRGEHELTQALEPPPPHRRSQRRVMTVEEAVAWTYAEQLETVTRYRTHPDAQTIDAAVEQLEWDVRPILRRYGRIASRPEGWEAQPMRLEPYWIDRPDFDERGHPKRGAYVVDWTEIETRKHRLRRVPHFVPLRRIGGVDSEVELWRSIYRLWWIGMVCVQDAIDGHLKAIDLEGFSIPEFPWAANE